MHKGIMLIVKSDNKEEALERARNFLEEYQDQVWDWYAIGGRWTQTLCPKYTKFIDWADKYLKGKSGKDYISNKDTKDNQELLQAEWVKLGMSGQNPYADHYKLPEEGGFYDVWPLNQCLDIVKKWQQTVEDAKKEEEKAKEWLNGIRAKDDYHMYGYSLKIAANLYYQSFCFDTNVFNVEKYDYSIPEDVKGFFVVMVDIHN